MGKILKYKAHKNTTVILGIVLITLLPGLPLLVPGIHSGHDIWFHLWRIDAIAQELQDLNFPVRMQSLLNNGYGYPTSIYYGDLLLYIPALLRMAGVSMMAAYKIFVWLINFGTAVLSFLSFQKIFKDKRIGLIAAMAYATAAYRFTDLYIRASTGEYVATMFLPIVALAVYRIYTDEGEWKRNAGILALGMTGILTSHTLTLEMCIVVLLVVCVLLFKKTFRKQTIKTYGLAVIWTFLLNAWFLVPFLDFQKNELVLINQKISLSTQLIQKKGASVGELFSYFGYMMQDMILSPGIVLMAAFFVGLAACWIIPKNKKIRLFTGLAGLTLFLSTNLFPWDFLAKTSKTGNLLAQIQFPWRYLVFADLFLTLLLGELFISLKTNCFLPERILEKISALSRPGRKFKKYAPRLIVLVCVVFSLAFLTQYKSDANLVSYMEITSAADKSDRVYLKISEGESIHREDVQPTSDDLYLRISVDENGNVKKADVNDTDTDVIKSDSVKECEIVGQNSGLERTVKVSSGDKEGWIEFPVFNYKGYRVMDENGNVYEISDGTNFRIRVEIPANFDGELTLSYCEPWYWRVSEIVSLVALVSFLCMLRISKTKDKRSGGSCPDRS